VRVDCLALFAGSGSKLPQQGASKLAHSKGAL